MKGAVRMTEDEMNIEEERRLKEQWRKETGKEKWRRSKTPMGIGREKMTGAVKKIEV